MDKATEKSLRDQVKSWTCNHFTIANLEGDSVALLRKVAESIEQLGGAEILDIAFRRSSDPSSSEITVSVYFNLSE